MHWRSPFIIPVEDVDFVPGTDGPGKVLPEALQAGTVQQSFRSRYLERGL